MTGEEAERVGTRDPRLAEDSTKASPHLDETPGHGLDVATILRLATRRPRSPRSHPSFRAFCAPLLRYPLSRCFIFKSRYQGPCPFSSRKSLVCPMPRTINTG